MLLGGALKMPFNGHMYHANESTNDHFHALDQNTIIGQYGDPGQFAHCFHNPEHCSPPDAKTMPILLSLDAGRTWSSPAAVSCNPTTHNATEFQCFSGDSIVVQNSSDGRLAVRDLGVPSPVGQEGEFASQGTEFSVDKITGHLTIAKPGRTVRFLGTQPLPHTGCWTGVRAPGFSWATTTSIVQLKSGVILATTAICVHNVSHPGWGSPPGKLAASMALYRSDDGGFTFRFVTLVADARDYTWSYFGPGSEHSVAVLSDGKTLMVVNRFDGNGGCGSQVPAKGDKPLTTTSHYTEYHVQFSTSEGKTWSKAVPLPRMGCARPKLLMLGQGKGPLLLAGGLVLDGKVILAPSCIFH